MSRGLLAALIALVALLPLMLRADLHSDVLSLLPEDAELRQAVEVLEWFDGGDMLLIEVDGREVEESELFAVVGSLTEELESLPHVREVHAGMDLEQAGQIRERLAPHAAAFVPAKVLAERTSEQGIRAALMLQLSRLSGPGAGLVKHTLSRDPLNLEEAALRSLAEGAPGVRSLGGMLQIEPGKALLFAQLDRSPAAVGPDDPVVLGIEGVLEAQGLPVSWFGGHRMAHDTARAVRTDVERATGVGLVALALVLLVGFRTARPLVGALGPLAVTVAFLIAGVGLVSPVHGIQLGFVSVIAGLAVDYWIHLYVVASGLDPDTGFAGRREAAMRALAEIRVPLLLSNGSTVLVFAVLSRSEVPIVRDLGTTGAVALLGALVGTMGVGPLAYAVVGRARSAVNAPAAVRPLAAGVVLLTAASLAALAPGARFNGDPTALLATSTEAAELDAYYAKHGLTGYRGIVAITGEDLLDRALAIETALGQQGFAHPIGPAAVMPGPGARAERAQALPSVEVLQARIDAAAEEIGFAPFPGAAERIYAGFGPVPPDLWQGTLLQTRLDRYLSEDAALVTLALADANVVPALADAVAAVDPEAAWFAPRIAAQQGITVAAEELTRTGLIGLAGVFLVLFARYRDLAKTVLALLPVGVALAAASGGVVVLGEPWNPVSFGILALAVGLALDYGVFMVESPGADTQRAVWLGAATTIGAIASLWLAASPALRSVGIVLTFAVGGALAAALIVIPALVAPSAGMRKAGRFAWRLATAVVLLVQADVMLNLWGTYAPTAPSLEPPAVESDGRVWTLGPNRRTWAEGIWLVETEGSPYSSGQAMGALTVDLRVRLEDELFDSFERQVSSPLARWLVTRSSLVLGKTLPDHIRPEYLVQIQGVADSAHDPYLLKGSAYTRRVFYHAIHDLGQAFVDSPLVGCTGFVAGGEATADGHWLLARNFDFEGGVAFDRDKVVWVHQPDEGMPFLSVSFAGMVGSVTGINADGLAVAINASGSEDPIRPGTPMTLIVREILQYASTLDEAQVILDKRRGFVSENVYVVDADAGQAALFEVTPERVAVVEVDEWLAVSNHFRSPELGDDPVNVARMAELTTVPRLERMEELLRAQLGSLDMASAAGILGDQRGVGGTALPRAHRHAIDADIASHGVVIDVTTRTLWVSRYPNLSGGMMRFNLDEVLAGTFEPVEVVPARETAAASVAARSGRGLLRASRTSTSETAIEQAAEALERMPEHPEALFELGRRLHESGDAEAARPLLERALAAPPEYAHQREAIERLLETP